MLLSGKSFTQPCKRVQPFRKPAEAAIIEVHAVTTGAQVRGTLQVGMAAAAIYTELLANI
jgi:hypothetical protein